MSKKPTLEDVRSTLETARTHIETKWMHGAWFKWENGDGKDFGEQVPKGAPVIGVCLAGSVLYALDYLDEQWTEKEKVVPVIEALFDNLPPRSRVVRQYKNMLAGWERGGSTPLNNPGFFYSEKLDGIISWNDTRGRTKQEVLDLFDRTIKDVVARMAPSITEEP